MSDVRRREFISLVGGRLRGHSQRAPSRPSACGPLPSGTCSRAPSAGNSGNYSPIIWADTKASERQPSGPIRFGQSR
jgi:hypothetical protein